MTATDYQVRLIQSLDDFNAIEQDWQALWQQQGQVFQSFAWLSLWAQHYQPWIAQLHILTVWQQQQLVAALPCYLRTQSWLGFKQQQLWLMGTGEPEHSEACAEYMDMLVLPVHQQPAVAALAAAIANNTSIHALCFTDSKPDACLNLLMTALTATFPVQKTEPIGWNFAVPLTKQGPDFLPTASKKLKRLYKKLQKQPHRLIVAKDLAIAQQLLTKLIELHQRRWQSQGKSGVFASKVFLAFHQALLSELLQSNQLLLAGLQVGDDIIAVHYCFISQQQCWFYQGGIDSNYTPNLSPGLLLHYLLARYCCQLGLECYDLMKSASSSDYKSALCTVTSTLWQHRLYRSVGTRLKAHLLQRFSAS